MNQDIKGKVLSLSAEQKKCLVRRLRESKHRRNISELTAYIQPEKSGKLDVEAAISDLREYLPSYMIPKQLYLVEAFPLLPNGKIDKHALISSVTIPNEKQPVHTPEGIGDLEKKLQMIWEDTLRMEGIYSDDNFFELGGDSILSISVVSKARKAGLKLNPADLFEYPTISQLASYLHQNSEQKLPDTGKVQHECVAPLTPIQNWFFSLNLSNPNQWNQTRVYEVATDTEFSLLQEAISIVTKHHDALNVRFSVTGSESFQQLSDTKLDITSVSIDENVNIPESLQQLGNGIQAGFLLEKGPLVKYIYVESESGNQKFLLICAHHLVIDAVSWRILIEDIEQAYNQVSRNNTEGLLGGESYLHWAALLDRISDDAWVTREADYWDRLPIKSTGSIPRDFDSIKSFEGSAVTLTTELQQSLSDALIGQVHSIYGTSVRDFLLTALTKILHEWTGRAVNSIGTEGHGREPLEANLDLSRSIGWFTSFYPMCLEYLPASSLGDQIRHTKEMVRKIPQHGIGYGLAHYNSDIRDQEEWFNGQPDLLFNYLGKVESRESVSSMFHQLPIEIDTQRDKENRRTHLLEINCYISSGCLHMHWTYDRSIHNDETIKGLANQFLEYLEALVQHCLSAEKSKYSPSDFPDAELDQDELDSFIDSLN